MFSPIIEITLEELSTLTSHKNQGQGSKEVSDYLSYEHLFYKCADYQASMMTLCYSEFSFPKTTLQH